LNIRVIAISTEVHSAAGVITVNSMLLVGFFVATYQVNLLLLSFLRFWLIDCQNINGCARMANDLYREAVSVPMVAKFAIFGRRRNPAEARLRAFCLTDDKLEKTLEKEQYFKELTRSKDIEVVPNKFDVLLLALVGCLVIMCSFNEDIRAVDRPQLVHT